MLRLLSCAALCLTLCACTSSVRLEGATAVEKGQDSVLVTVHMDESDVSDLSAAEYYYSLVIVDCETGIEIYPIRPFVGEIPASRFSKSNNDKVSGTIPKRIFLTAKSPCVFLRGGSYFSGKIKSNVVRVALN